MSYMTTCETGGKILLRACIISRPVYRHRRYEKPLLLLSAANLEEQMIPEHCASIDSSNAMLKAECHWEIAIVRRRLCLWEGGSGTGLHCSLDIRFIRLSRYPNLLIGNIGCAVMGVFPGDEADHFLIPLPPQPSSSSPSQKLTQQLCPSIL